MNKIKYYVQKKLNKVKRQMIKRKFLQIMIGKGIFALTYEEPLQISNKNTKSPK